MVTDFHPTRERLIRLSITDTRKLYHAVERLLTAPQTELVGQIVELAGVFDSLRPLGPVNRRPPAERVTARIERELSQASWREKS